MSQSEPREEVVFEAALQLPADQRAAYLDKACAGDADLRRRVEVLLGAFERADGFMKQPATPIPSRAVAISLPPTEKPGDRIGRYKLFEQIGEGGCGVVYMAEQTEPVRRRVALKVIKLGMDTKQVIARFEAERQALALMDHPNIAKVLDAGTTETGRPYFVMELVKGIRITDYCDQNHLSTEERLGLFMQVCQAIQHAHQKGIIHRDIKPSNILVTLHDGVPVPKVIDFGIAKAMEQPLTEKTVFTAFGQFMGTPAYMSPEQAELSGLDIDTRSDIYALGVLLYELLTGKTPFDAKELLQAGLDEMRRRIREDEPMRPSTRLSTMTDADLTEVAQQRHSEPAKLTRFIRGDLDWIVMKCLEKDRTRRYETANGLAADIRRHLENEPVVACPPSTGYRFQKLVRRNKLAVAAVGSVAAALAIGLGIAAWQFFEKSRAYERAIQAEKKSQKEVAKSQQVAKFLKEMLGSAGPSVARGRDAALFREMLEVTSGRVGKELAGQPEVQGDIHATIGSAFMDIGDYRRAITNLELAVKSYRIAQLGDHSNLAFALSSLGYSQSFTEDVANGNKNARLGLEMARKCNDKERLFNCLINYALSFRPWAMTSPEAEPSLKEALELKKRMGNDPVGLAIAMRCYSGFSTNAQENEQMLRNAVDLFQKHLPSGHPQTVHAAFSLGQVLVGHKKYVEAEQVLKEALQGFHKTHDPNHPHQSIVLSYLLYALIGESKLEEAESELHKHVISFPDKTDYYDMLARFRMQYGGFGSAFEPLPAGLLAKLERGEFLATWAVLLLHEGANTQYEEYRRRYLDVAFTRVDFERKMHSRVAKALLLRGGDSNDITRSCRFAELVITNVEEKDRYSIEEVRGLIELRKGEFAAASDWASRVVKREDGWKPRKAEAWFIKAIACSHLQRPEAARTALAEGEELLKSILPDGKEGDLFNVDWILGRYLADEARKKVAALPESSPAEEDDKTNDPLARITDPEQRANIFAQRAQWANAALELAKAIELSQTNHLLFRTQGDVLGRIGHWKGAVVTFSKCIELKPDDSWPYLRLAPILLLTGDEAGYRQLCQRIVARFSGTKDIGAADTLAKACSIHPRSGVDLGAVAEAAETAVTVGKQSEYFPWFALGKSLAEYRQEHFTSAADWAQRTLAAAGQIPERDAAAYLVLAMAQQQLKQHEAARAAWARGSEIVEKKLPKLENGDLGGQWVDVIIANLLLREAGALIEGQINTGAEKRNESP